MILSVSRRTDIPALYGEWFLNRLRAGEVLVRNPINRKQVSSIPLSPQNIDCIVFWTKNPSDFIQYLDEIDSMGYNYYFTFSLTSYGRDIERSVGDKKKVLQTFKSLSDRIGPQRVIWRYDPILFSFKYTEEYHLKWFAYLLGELTGYTEKCVISFLEEYGKIGENIKNLNIYDPGPEKKRSLLMQLSAMAEKAGLKMAACAQEEDYRSAGVEPNRCIDAELIGRICKNPIRAIRDKSQRPACGCAESRDIGTYNTCTNDCVYCYANINKRAACNNFTIYSPDSPLLCDTLKGDEKISPYGKSRSLKVIDKQGELF